MILCVGFLSFVIDGILLGGDIIIVIEVDVLFCFDIYYDVIVVGKVGDSIIVLLILEDDGSCDLLFFVCL